jgi:nucleotide-binding universal stress UspA family protein
MTLQILVPIHTYPDGNVGNLALHAAIIARQLNADVHAVVLNADFQRISSPLGNVLLDVPALIGGAKAKCRERGAAVVLAMETAMGPLGIPLRTTHTECFPFAAGDIVSSLGRYHDFILVGIGKSDATPQATAEAAVFGSGRPTLLVPEDAVPTQYQHVMIAWDGSRVATRAVADAREFLRLAKTVTIAVVTDEKTLPEENPGLKLVDYFNRNGINSTVALVESQGRPIARALQDHALEIGADMMVMGAFGHSRMRDFVMGGATTGILRDLKLPVLFSH